MGKCSSNRPFVENESFVSGSSSCRRKVRPDTTLSCALDQWVISSPRLILASPNFILSIFWLRPFFYPAVTNDNMAPATISGRIASGKKQVSSAIVAEQTALRRTTRPLNQFNSYSNDFEMHPSRLSSSFGGPRANSMVNDAFREELGADGNDKDNEFVVSEKELQRADADENDVKTTKKSRTGSKNATLSIQQASKLSFTPKPNAVVEKTAKPHRLNAEKNTNTAKKAPVKRGRAPRKRKDCSPSVPAGNVGDNENRGNADGKDVAEASGETAQNEESSTVKKAPVKRVRAPRKRKPYSSSVPDCNAVENKKTNNSVEDSAVAEADD